MTQLPEQFQLNMHCDHKGCLAVPTRAARIVVPALSSEPDHASIRMRTDVHTCDRHKDEFADAADHLTPEVKRHFEMIARQSRPLGYRCDFDHAWIDFELVTTPEYRRFLAKLRFNRRPDIEAIHA